MEVDTLAIPSTQTVDGKSVAQVIGSRSDSAFFRLQSGLLEQTTEGTTCRFDRQPALVGANEKTSVRV